MKLPAITLKQLEILELLYSYRFLNRIQVQDFLGHKDKKTINLWLRDLKAKNYVDWIYHPDDYALRTKPAIYYLSLNGIRYLKTLVWDDDTVVYPLEQLRKRYKESTRSPAYIDRCVLLAECSLGFTQAGRNATTDTSSSAAQYHITTQAAYSDETSEYHFLVDGDLESQLGPQLVVSKHHQQKKTAHYLLEVFDTNLPRYRIKNRLKQYTTFLTEGEWEANRNDTEPLPTILLVCPRTTDLIYAKRRTRGLLADVSDDERRNIHVQFATIQNLQLKGVACREIWERA